MFDVPIDPEQVRVVPGHPDDPAIIGAGRVDPEVAVGDASGQRCEREVEAGQLGNRVEGGDEVVVESAVLDRFVRHEHSPGADGLRPPASGSVGRDSLPKAVRHGAMNLHRADVLLHHVEEIVHTELGEEEADLATLGGEDLVLRVEVPQLRA